MSDDKFKTDYAWGYCLEQKMNERARDGWLLAHITSYIQEGRVDGPTFMLVWYKPPEGCAAPIGFKVI